MCIFSSPKDLKDKNIVNYYYFKCITREQKAKILCNNTNVGTDILEDLNGLLHNWSN